MLIDREVRGDIVEKKYGIQAVAGRFR